MTNFDDLIWVTKGKNIIDVSIYLYIDSEASRIYAITQQPELKYLEIGLEEHRVDSRWSIPNRAEMESYRLSSAAYSFQNAGIMINEFILSDCVVSHHIEALSFDGQDIQFQWDDKRVLEPSFLMKLKSLHTGIYDTLYAKYRAEACISTSI